jgi:translation initiation factor IF-2
MAKKRIAEIADTHGLNAKELSKQLQEAGFSVPSPNSTIDEKLALSVVQANAPVNGASHPQRIGDVPTEQRRPRPAQPATGGGPRPSGGGGQRPSGGPRPGGRPEGRGPGGPGGRGANGASGRGPAAPGGRAPAAPGGRAPGGPAGRTATNGPSSSASTTPRTPRPGAPSGPRIVGGAPMPGTGSASGRAAGGGGGAAGGGGRPTRDDQRTGERAPAQAGGRRRVVIDSQAARRGPGGGPGGPGGGPPRRPPRSRGRRRRGTYDDTIQPLDVDAQSAIDKVKINSGSTVKDIAEYLGVAVPEIIKKLMTLGEMATLTQTLSDDAIQVIADEFDRDIEIVHAADDVDAEPTYEDEDEDLVSRPPVVTIMGHVDHGKTSLLDAIRDTAVTAGEAGGITQHIGAYQVQHNDKPITFLDTPGHQAFTAMRARGASVTDIVVLVVAADDGVKPQTEEAIDHARAAQVPIVVAVNKIDKEGADPARVRTELTQRDLQPAEWGGETEYVDVSAKTKQNLEDLLETIQVVADLEELRANPNVEASGHVIESKLDPGRGPVVTLLVDRGTLRVGDALVAGSDWGKVRALVDYTGKRLKQALPGDPVEVLGFDGVPEAGEFVHVVESDKRARTLAGERANRLKTEAIARRSGRKVSLEDVFTRAKSGEMKELNLVVKADVAGSLEAIEDEIAKLPQTEVFAQVIHRGVGGINESDIMLAAASDAVVLGFNVRPVGDASAVADREGVEIRSYSVIYRAVEELRAAMEGMLEPEEVEVSLGRAEIRQTFRASRIGVIAGSYVTEGLIRRGARARLVRDGTVVYTGEVESLRRFQEDVREVQTGFECGIVLRNFQDVKEGDVVEAYDTKRVDRELT